MDACDDNSSKHDNVCWHIGSFCTWTNCVLRCDDTLLWSVGMTDPCCSAIWNPKKPPCSNKTYTIEDLLERRETRLGSPCMQFALFITA
jgi:hypothetical protein